MMSVETFEMIKIATDVARKHNIENVNALRERLLQRFPTRTATIDAAIRAWADYVCRNAPGTQVNRPAHQDR